MTCFPKSTCWIVERVDQCLSIEHINALDRLEKLRSSAGRPIDASNSLGKSKLIKDGASLGFSSNRIIFRVASVCMMPIEPAAPAREDRSVAIVRSAFASDVLLQHFAEIHIGKAGHR
jgi:hypothetical protein